MNMKLIIYAVGRVFQSYKDKINWTEVIALADKKVMEAGSVIEAGREYPLIGPAAITKQKWSCPENILFPVTGSYLIRQSSEKMDFRSWNTWSAVVFSAWRRSAARS